MCPIFFYLKGEFHNEKAKNGKRGNTYLFGGLQQVFRELSAYFSLDAVMQ